MKVGDRVRITAKYSGNQFNKVGVITKSRGLAEWYVKLDEEGHAELSWRETSMEFADTAHERAVQVLGEDYFA